VEPAASGPEEERTSVHAQGTVISEEHGTFQAPYSGLNSLERDEPRRTSITGTLFLGARLPWKGGEIYLDPEIAGGEGFSGVTGIAGFPNGEIPRVASPTPEPYIARLFLRQTFGLGGETERVEPGPNMLAGLRDVSRITVTLGKVSAADFFDGNAYSHDPRGQFMNWSLMDNGAWDYPADTRGYTLGGTVELNQRRWALRYGVFEMPKVANGSDLDSRIPKSLAQALELEERWSLGDRSGTVRILGYRNGAHMGTYRQAIEHPGPTGPDITLTRAYTVKYGFGVQIEQQLTDTLGLFGHAGWNDGRTESFAFTEIDRTVAAGLSFKGTRWHRSEDVLGIAVVGNGLSNDHRVYLAAGGYGFIIGDGRLRYGYEKISEAYYLIKLVDHVAVTADFQHVEHPAYNRDRGPVTVTGLRVHLEF
jgi:high affinity Mn2+ porin